MCYIRYCIKLPNCGIVNFNIVFYICYLYIYIYVISYNSTIYNIICLFVKLSDCLFFTNLHLSILGLKAYLRLERTITP